MGRWGYKPGESDTFADVYDAFFDACNDGASPIAATDVVRSELADFLEDADDKFDAYFALALAQWQTQSLNPALLGKVDIQY